MARTTVKPTFSSDHFNCFWLGNYPPKQNSGVKMINAAHDRTSRRIFLIIAEGQTLLSRGHLTQKLSTQQERNDVCHRSAYQRQVETELDGNNDS